jgi:hypothetical protein
MIKKGKLHHKGSKNTKPGIEGVGLAPGSSRPSCLCGEYFLRELCVSVMK